MTPPHPSPAPTREEEKQELASLLTLPEIARSTNLVRLLSFVCEKYFEGRTEEIRESSIAIQALGRKREAFDSQADPIVRVTARTLRKRLDEYYRREGRARHVQLVLPTGQYVPRFLRCEGPLGEDLDLPGRLGGEDPEEVEAFGTDHGPAVAANALEPHESAPAAVAGYLQPRTGPSPAGLPRGRERRRWTRAALAFSAAAACVLSFWLGRRTGVKNESTAKPIEVWGSPSWSDEFDGPEGAAPDPTRWTHEIGNNDGWGNQELEVYCAPGSASPPPCDPSTPNAHLDGSGNLVIQAVRNPQGTWTSARLKTQGLQEFQYGRIEVRLRLPVGAGLWPAFWMLGTNVASAGWPGSGSVTILENVPKTASSNGLGPTVIRSTIHGPGYFGWNGLWQNYTLRNGGRVDDGSYHTYGATWSPHMIQFYVDDPSNVFCVRSAADVPAGGEWVFNHPFFLVMNLAVGGLWPGPPDDTTPNPSRVVVDYVRVYQAAQVPGPTLWAPALSVKAGHTGTAAITLSSISGTGRAYLSCSGAPKHSTCSLSTAVVDFSNTGTQTATLTIATKSGFGADARMSAPGRYSLAVTAVTVSSDSSTLPIPLTVY